MQAHMYVRVKRQKLTVFLSVAPTDTIEAMQLALQEQINEVGVGFEAEKSRCWLYIYRRLPVGRAHVQSCAMYC